MRVRRGYLFWGIVLVLLGAIPLAERAEVIEPGQLGDIARFWPVVLIVLGLAIVTTRIAAIGLLGTIVAGLVVGGLAGGALAVASDWSLVLGDCAGGPSTRQERTVQSGAFDGPGRVELSLACGSIDLQAGSVTSGLTTWSLAARHREAAPSVTSGPSQLRVASPRTFARHEWVLFVPGDLLRELDVDANAANVDLDLSGGTLVGVDLEFNAVDARVLAADATIGRMDLEANAARVQLTLGGPASVTVEANASAIEICVPPSARLEVRLDEGFVLSTNLDERGLDRQGAVWTRAGTGEPVIITVRGNATNLALDPADGCSREGVS
jgi:hypothetical protein